MRTEKGEVAPRRGTARSPMGQVRGNSAISRPASFPLSRERHATGMSDRPIRFLGSFHLREHPDRGWKLCEILDLIS
jgi:hypothetical protein